MSDFLLLFDNLNLVRDVGDRIAYFVLRVGMEPVKPSQSESNQKLVKLGKIPYRWILEATEGVFDRDERVDLPEEVAFSRLDFAESPPLLAFARVKRQGRGLPKRIEDGWLRIAKLRMSNSE